MWTTVKTTFTTVHQSFHKSGTIVFARLQIALAAIWFALTSVDLAPLIGNPKYVTLWLVFSGLVTEYTRRSRTIVSDDGHLEPCRDGHNDPTVNVTVNTAPAATPVPTDGTTK